MIIFIKGPLESLNYFIDEMSRDTKNAVILDVEDNNFHSRLFSLYDKIDSSTHVITFNSIGINIVIDNSINYWESKHVKLYNIMVDPPHYFIDCLNLNLSCMEAVVVDADALDFIHRFYPNQKCRFLPHGGAYIQKEHIPYADRPYDIVYFAGRKSCNPLDAPIEKTAFEMLTKYPDITLDHFFDLYIAEENIILEPGADKLLLMGLYYTVFQNIKSYFQEQIITAITNAGIKLHVFGGGYRNMEKYSNLIIHSAISPEECVRIMHESKIVINMMPWFKNGSHERIFNAMLNNSIALTDSSIYLKNRFHDMEDIVFYELNNPQGLVDRINLLLNDTDLAECIIYNQKKSAAHDRWCDRLDELLSSPS